MSKKKPPITTKLYGADLTELVADNHNANRGTDKGRKMLADSVRDLGAGRSIVVDKNGIVIGGNKTRDAMIAAGMKDAVIVETDGKSLVVVKRTDLDMADLHGPARRMAYADNRVAEIDLDWDPAVVMADLDMGVDLDGLFSEKDRFAFMDDVGRLLTTEDELQPLNSDGEGADAPADPAPRRAEVGHLWQLGEHRLLVGDSTDATAVGKLLGNVKADMCWTDPPYNVDIESKSGKHIANDALGAAFPAFVEKFTAVISAWVKPGGPIYAAMSTQEMGCMDALFKKAGFHWSTTIIWVKDAFTLSRGHFHQRYEPIWYGWIGGAPCSNPVVERDVDNVWNVARPRVSLDHPTMKPVELVARSLRYSSAPGDVVLDLFGGSGTTMVACDQLGRKARLVELSPLYADVIIRRWERLNNGTAVLLNP